VLKQQLYLVGVVILVLSVIVPSVVRSNPRARFNRIDGKPAVVWLGEMRGGVETGVVAGFGGSQQAGIPALLDLVQMRDHLGARFYRSVSLGHQRENAPANVFTRVSGVALGFRC
jgi:hypothetical protein